MSTLHQEFGGAASRAFPSLVSDLARKIAALDRDDKADVMDLFTDFLTNEDADERAKDWRMIVEIANGEAPEEDVSLVEIPGEHDSNTRGEAPDLVRQRNDWIAHQIKTERKKRDWTQQQLAAKADLPQSHISRLENAEHSPSRKTIEKLAAAFEISTDAFDHP